MARISNEEFPPELDQILSPRWYSFGGGWFTSCLPRLVAEVTHNPATNCYWSLLGVKLIYDSAHIELSTIVATKIRVR